MNNKGFMFIETIMVVTILSTALIMLYSTYSGLLTDEKRRNMYDDTSLIYTTYYLEDYIVSLNLEDFIEENLNGDELQILSFSCNSDTLFEKTNEGQDDVKEQLNAELCELLIGNNNTDKRINFNKIYITKYDLTKIKKCISKTGRFTCANDSDFTSAQSTINTLNSNMLHYIKTISGKGDDKNKLCLIVEYKERRYLGEVTNALQAENCENKQNRALKGGKCYYVKDYYYYNNIVLVPRRERNVE